MREDPDVDFAFPLEVAVDGDTAGFDLAVRHPGASDGLEAEVSEGNGGSALGVSGAASAVALAELGTFGHQWHGWCPPMKMLMCDWDIERLGGISLGGVEGGGLRHRRGGRCHRVRGLCHRPLSC